MSSRAETQHILAPLFHEKGADEIEYAKLIMDAVQMNPWCKLFCEKDSEGNEKGQPYYFTNLVTGESSWEEPQESYWLWDYLTGQAHVSGLQKPTPKEKLDEEQYVRDEEKAPLQYDENATKNVRNGWQGYDPKVHGSYDPKAPYTAYHSYLKWKDQQADPSTAQPQQQSSNQVAHGYTAAFNAHTGAFQTGEQSAERHDDYHKSGRQMSAFFDVDAAVNAHQGRSLKAERQQQRYSKEEIKAMKEKRKNKKHDKRMAFLRS